MSPEFSDDSQDWSWAWHGRILSLITAGLLFLFVAARALMGLVS